MAAVDDAVRDRFQELPRRLGQGVVVDGASTDPLSEAELVELRSSTGDHIVATTHPGFGYKPVNEDRISMVETANGGERSLSVFVVDGMGGHHSGDVCAQVLSEELIAASKVDWQDLADRGRELLLEKVLELVFRLPAERLVNRIVAAIDEQIPLHDAEMSVEEIHDLAVEIVQVESIQVENPRPEVLQQVAEIVHRVMGLSLPDRTELAVRSARRRIDALGFREKAPDACFVGCVIRTMANGLRTLDIKQVGDCKMFVRSAGGEMRFESIGESVIAEPDLLSPDLSLAQLMTYSLHRNFVSNSMNTTPLNTKRYRRADIPLALDPGDVIYLYSDGCDDLFIPAEILQMERSRGGRDGVRSLLTWAERRMRLVNAALVEEQKRRSPAEIRLAYPAVHQRMNEQRVVAGRYAETYPDASEGSWVKPPKCDNFAFVRIEIADPRVDGPPGS